MELEEAKKVLMNLPQYQERGNEEYEAIDTVIHELVALQELLDEKREEIETALQKIKRLQKANKKLKEENRLLKADNITFDKLSVELCRKIDDLENELDGLYI